jgi:hypothetical protein
MVSTRTVLILLLCIASLAMRVGSAHLHMCLDGQEPRASIAYGDDPIQPPSVEVGLAHQDYDIDLESNSIGKLQKIDFNFVALLFLLSLSLLSLRRQPSFVRAPAQLARLLQPSHLRPPPCGPPLNFVV